MNCNGMIFFVNLVKNIAMSTAELKLKLFREIDILEQSKLEQVYGLVLNFINKDNDNEEWNTLTKPQQKGLIDAIEEMNSSEGIDHKKIIAKYKKKYA
jgi:hypothetical protein